MKHVTRTVLGLAACGAIGVLGFAAVVIDEDGLGFVGKGDVQNAYGWNNAALQANAHLLEFRFTSAGMTTWECEEWQDHQIHGVRLLGIETYDVSSVNSSIAYDARKNKNGQITGFNLNGFTATESSESGDTDLEPGECPPATGGNNPKWYVFVEGSLETTVTDEGTVEVTIDGIDWTAIGLEVDQGE